ncbi:hypothetical protein BGX28_007731 [Mortierella sp. GBA30]|nr:hypothetical protein BGX28_007731 [Mortierella sp. GBA30]
MVEEAESRSDKPFADRMVVMAAGSEGMLNDAGMDQQYPEYRLMHVCKWGKDWDEPVYWDERDVVDAVMATGWDDALWLDWVDIPTLEGHETETKECEKANKLKTQAELYALASRIFVFVPNGDFKLIERALLLSAIAATINEFVDVIRLLSSVKWFSSQ